MSGIWPVDGVDNVYPRRDMSARVLGTDLVTAGGARWPLRRSMGSGALVPIGTTSPTRIGRYAVFDGTAQVEANGVIAGLGVGDYASVYFVGYVDAIGVAQGLVIATAPGFGRYHLSISGGGNIAGYASYVGGTGGGAPSTTTAPLAIVAGIPFIACIHHTASGFTVAAQQSGVIATGTFVDPNAGGGAPTTRLTVGVGFGIGGLSGGVGEAIVARDTPYLAALPVITDAMHERLAAAWGL